MKKILPAAFVLCLLAAPAFGQATAITYGANGTAQATASVTLDVITTLSVAVGQNIDFGAITTDVTALSMNGTGAITSGGNTIVGSGQYGQFNISGQSGANVLVSGPGTVPLNLGSTNATVTFTPTMYNSSGGTLASTTFPLTGGSASVRIGGSLAVSGTPVAGDTYTGNYTLTVSYASY